MGKVTTALLEEVAHAKIECAFACLWALVQSRDSVHRQSLYVDSTCSSFAQLYARLGLLQRRGHQVHDLLLVCYCCKHTDLSVSCVSRPNPDSWEAKRAEARQDSHPPPLPENQ